MGLSYRVSGRLEQKWRLLDLGAKEFCLPPWVPSGLVIVVHISLMGGVFWAWDGLPVLLVGAIHAFMCLSRGRHAGRPLHCS
ncbi:MAG: hypothetical protein WD267_01890 [Balneolales bacterium]